MTSTRLVTAYRYVADTLRRQILGGTIASGQQLPPERELCERFSASRITIRRALQILAEEMLIERRQGLGTFVSPVPSRRIPLLNSDFSGSMASHAPDLERALESHAWREANAVVAAALQLRPGAHVHFARRLDLLRATPVAYDEIHLPEPFADRLSDADLSELRFLERWQRIQRIRLDYLTQSIEAMPAGPGQKKFLGVEPGAPLLKEIDIVFTAAGVPCGLFESYYRHDLFQLTSTVRLSRSNENGDGDQ
jgi:GntR family transcriptional regulator